MENLREATASNSRLRVTAKKVKTFVLDTNVLLHDPQSIYKFQDNNLAIPVEVLEELDGIKGEQSTERGRNARRVHRILQELLPDSRSMHEGVELEVYRLRSWKWFNHPWLRFALPWEVQRDTAEILDLIKPDVVHVMADGRIIKSGGPELALELEERGYDWLTKAAA